MYDVHRNSSCKRMREQGAAVMPWSTAGWTEQGRGENDRSSESETRWKISSRSRDATVAVATLPDCTNTRTSCGQDSSGCVCHGSLISYTSHYRWFQSLDAVTSAKHRAGSNTKVFADTSLAHAAEKYEKLDAKLLNIKLPWTKRTERVDSAPTAFRDLSFWSPRALVEKGEPKRPVVHHLLFHENNCKQEPPKISKRLNLWFCFSPSFGEGLRIPFPGSYDINTRILWSLAYVVSSPRSTMVLGWGV